MNNWLIVHSLDSFADNSRMIGFQAKEELDGKFRKDENGKVIPAFERINEIKKGDKIVYYCKGDSVIKGIYEINRINFAKEKKWSGSPFQFELKPIIELDEPLEFKPLISSLDLFKHLDDVRKWGMSLQGKYNSIKPLTDKDYNLILKSVENAEKSFIEEKEEYEEELEDYGTHLLQQYKIAEWGLKNGYRVHIAINDKNKIKEKLPKVLEEIPKFHAEDIVNIAKRIDVLFFRKERDILTHAFEVEHTTNIYSGLLRLNDIAEKYPPGNTKYLIISNDNNKDKFYRELDRPSFSLLKDQKCEFFNYKEIDEEWKEVKNRKPPKF